jgi:lipopolysaccharide transport system permease protein
MKFIIDPFRLLWSRRSLLYQTTRNDIKSRYAGSALGLVWLFLYPLLFLSVYAVIYITIFKVRFSLFNTNEYVAIIFCGLIPFLGFSEALGAGVGSVNASSNMIKNTLFPIELIPVKTVLTTQSTQVVGTGMLLIAIVLLGRLSTWVLFLPIVWLLQLLFTIGLIWILSSMAVLLRDLQNIIPIVIIMLMMISPIAYTVDMVPDSLRPFLGLNPLYYLIISYQDILMLGKFPENNILWVLVAMSFTTFLLGFWIFKRLKNVFADNV